MQLLERIYAKQKSLLHQLSDKVSDQLIQLDIFQDASQETFRPTVDSLLQKTLIQMNLTFTDDEYSQVLEIVIAELAGFGLLEVWLSNATISEIYVLRYDRIYFKQEGELKKSSFHFQDEEHIQQMIDRMTAPFGNAARFRDMLSIQVRKDWHATIFTEFHTSHSASIILKRHIADN